MGNEKSLNCLVLTVVYLFIYFSEWIGAVIIMIT